MTRSSRQDPSSDARIDLGAYTVTEAAHHLRLPLSTVRSWAVGRPYKTASGTRRFMPVIEVADRRKLLLSFRNLVELHVLSAIRRKHEVRLKEVRSAIRFLRRQLGGGRHPLADLDMSTDGTDLFIEHYGHLVNASQEGQMAMKAALAGCLERIERDPKGLAIRLYPFSGRPEARAIVIDPRVRFGRPCVTGTGVATDVIVDRFDAGDTIDEIARDYGRPARDIEEAIRFEKAAA